MPVVGVEVEVSLQAYGQETRDGEQRANYIPFLSGQVHAPLLGTCKERGMGVIAYS